MGSQVVIDPVTRIEGHSKITIFLNDDGAVDKAQFHVTQFRGFEKLCEGRPVHEMPSLMARICGICPVSHLTASAKTVDAIMAVKPPPTGANLRRIMNLGQIVQSNALSFFHLSSPDLLFGYDGDPEKRNLYGLVADNPQLAKDGIALRRYGQQIIEWLGKKRIHPAWCVPGGVSAPLDPALRDQMLAGMPEAYAIMDRTLAWYKKEMVRFEEEASAMGEFPSAFMSLISDDGGMEHYDGDLRIVDQDGTMLRDRCDATDYKSYLGERTEPFSFLKSTYFKDKGYPDGIYRVGTLARLATCEHTGLPRSQKELDEYRQRFGRYPQSTFHFHYSRLIDILFCLEKIEALLNDPDILSDRVRSTAGINSNVGIGVSEAPRGTLLHHYEVDDDGIMKYANLIIATGHNNLAMNQGVTDVAKHFIKPGQPLEEAMLNRVEGLIRCYDPCLSCSTHALGKMALHIQMVSPDGKVVDEIKR